MGSSEMDKSAKDTKDSTKESKTPTPQEQTPGTATATVNADWTGFQAYSPVPPHGFLATNPQAHPYMWGVQHLMPPYGTPPHPYVMYPHGGIYAHPSMHPGSYPFGPFAMPSPNGVAEASGNTHGSMEVDGKSPEGKEKLPIKRSKGSLGSLHMITGKNDDPNKTGPSANGGYPKSAESGSDSSTEGSDANSENGSQRKSRSRPNSMEGEASQNGNMGHGSQNGGPNTPFSMVNQTMSMVPISTSVAPGNVSGPTTNLNIGNMQPQLWIQDERELKRQRRKQSNRESARRSRLRKQAECDELAQRAEALNQENATLRGEVNRIRSEHEQLLAQNASLKERLEATCRQGEVNSVRNEPHTSGENHQGVQTERV